MKKKLSIYFAFIFVLSVIFFLGGCNGNKLTFYETTFPSSFKIVVRISNGSNFFEETFIRCQTNKIYYYKFQEYTKDFESLNETMVQYVGIKNESDQFIKYAFDSGSWYEISSSFESEWSNLNFYCLAPSFGFKASEAQPDSTVNKTKCYTYLADGTTYKISKDKFNMVWYQYGKTHLAYVEYEIQSLKTESVLSGIETNGLPVV